MKYKGLACLQLIFYIFLIITYSTDKTVLMVRLLYESMKSSCRMSLYKVASASTFSTVELETALPITKAREQSGRSLKLIHVIINILPNNMGNLTCIPAPIGS